MSRVELWPCAVGAHGVAEQSCLPLAWLPVASTCKLQGQRRLLAKDPLSLCAGPWGCLSIIPGGSLSTHTSAACQNPAPNPSAFDLEIHARKPTGDLVVHEECQSTGQGETQWNGKISVKRLSFLCILKHLLELNRALSLAKE